MKLSVIIPTRDKAAFLERTLASYCQQTHPEFEVVIADDGSSDDATARVVDSFRGRLSLDFLTAAHAGRAACRNRAVQRARCDILVFSDDDILAGPDFLSQHAQLHAGDERRVVLGAQRRIGEVPLSQLEAGSLDWTAASTPEPWWEEVCATIGRTYGDQLQGFAIPWVMGATRNLSVSRQLVLAVGGFDEQFRGWGLEDLDLCYRLHHGGARTVLGQAAVSCHQEHPTSPDGQRWIEWLRNLLRFMDKYDRVDAAAYAHAFTRGVEVDLAGLSELVCALDRDAERAPASTSALREAYRALTRQRVFALERSGAHGLPGIRW
jgi:glycosyltransferase involved in cell wall biosynthesis